MKTLITAGIAAAAVVAAIATSASGQSTPAPTTLRLVEHEAHFGFLDAPPKQGDQKPPTIGDEFVIDGPVTQAGKTAGRVGFVCTVTFPGRKETSNCVGTVNLAGGTIAVAGTSRSATNSDTYAVTGGTGAYASAKGTVFTKQAGGTSTDITITLGQ